MWAHHQDIVSPQRKYISIAPFPTTNLQIEHSSFEVSKISSLEQMSIRVAEVGCMPPSSHVVRCISQFNELCFWSLIIKGVCFGGQSLKPHMNLGRLSLNFYLGVEEFIKLKNASDWMCSSHRPRLLTRNCSYLHLLWWAGGRGDSCSLKSVYFDSPPTAQPWQAVANQNPSKTKNKNRI